MRPLKFALIFGFSTTLACASTQGHADDKPVSAVANRQSQTHDEMLENTKSKAPRPTSPSLEQRVTAARTYFEAFARHVGFQGSVLIAQNGKTLFAQDVGVTLSRSGGKSSAAPQYFIGSITKMFTAALVMREVERGNIALNAPVSRYLIPIPETRSAQVVQ